MLTKKKGEAYNRINILWAADLVWVSEHLWFKELDITEEATLKTG